MSAAPSRGPLERPVRRGERGTKHAAAVALLLVVGLAFARPAPAQSIAGYVVELEGDWRLEPPRSNALRRWDDVPVGAVFRRAAPMPGDKLKIVGPRGDLVFERTCAIDACAGAMPLAPPASGETASIASRILATALRRLHGDPDRPASHISRGDGDPPLVDSVVAIAPTIDLAPAFAGVAAGRYVVRIQPLVRAADRDETAGPFDIDWASGRTAGIPRGALRPGLVEIELLRMQGGRLRPAGPPAWLLLAPAARAAEWAASLADARALATGWAGRLEGATTRTLLRTHLEILAEDAGR